MSAYITVEKNPDRPPLHPLRWSWNVWWADDGTHGVFGHGVGGWARTRSGATRRALRETAGGEG